MANALWVTPDELSDDIADLPEAQIACEAASQLLWSLSGRKFNGVTTTTERYCLAPAPSGLIILGSHAGLLATTNAEVITTSVIRPEDLKRSRISLRGKSVRRIVDIYTEEGERVNPDRYTLWDSSFVEFSARITSDLYITYEYGGTIPALGRMAAKTLATQFTYLWSGREDECTLPDRVTNVTRQDVSWVLLDQQDFISELRTGVYAVDLFLKSVNPYGARLKSKVFSPDVPRANKAKAQPAKIALPMAPNIAVPVGGSTVTEINLAAMGLAFLDPAQGWDVDVFASSWGGTSTVEIPADQIVRDAITMTITIKYDDLVGALGHTNPGVYTVYASKNGASASVLTGNLSYIDVPAE